MTKYIFVGLINFFFAIWEMFLASNLLLNTIPKLKLLYAEFSASNTSINKVYVGVMFLFLLGVAHIFFGMKLFSKSEAKRDLYFKISLIFIVLTFILLWLIRALFNISIVSVLYELNSEL